NEERIKGSDSSADGKSNRTCNTVDDPFRRHFILGNSHKKAQKVFLLLLLCLFVAIFLYPARYSQMLSTACSSSMPLARTPTFEPYPADSNRMLRMLRASASTGLVGSARNRTMLAWNFEESSTSLAAARA